MNKIKNNLIRLMDLLLYPYTLVCAIWLKKVRSHISIMINSKKILLKVGVFPIKDHYHEPLFNPNYLRKPLDEDRMLPGIDFNTKEQLDILRQFNYNHELIKFPINKVEGRIEYYYNNDVFCSGDGEYLYNIIRLFKPNKIIEIGSGFSTLMTINAVNKNKKEDFNYLCEITCIEPYENKWLEKKEGINIIKRRLEEIDISLFQSLKTNDILLVF